MVFLFENKPGFNLRREKALRMLAEGVTHAEVCLELQISTKTLQAWIKNAGQSKGDPDLDQVSLIDGLSERERQKL